MRTELIEAAVMAAIAAAAIVGIICAFAVRPRRSQDEPKSATCRGCGARGCLDPPAISFNWSVRFCVHEDCIYTKMRAPDVRAAHLHVTCTRCGYTWTHRLGPPPAQDYGFGSTPWPRVPLAPTGPLRARPPASRENN